MRVHGRGVLDLQSRGTVVAHRHHQQTQAWSLERMPALLSLAQGYLLQMAVFPDFDEEAYFRAADLVFTPPVPPEHPAAASPGQPGQD